MQINKYIIIFVYLFLSFSILSIGQNISFNKIEQEMRKYINEDEEIKKQVVDLNNDGKWAGSDYRTYKPKYVIFRWEE